MRALLRPVLLPLLRRDTGEVARRAESFRIDSDRGVAFVRDLGQAFLGGFNSMLELESLRDVDRRGLQVASHFRPFFYEGAAMGYLPRGYYSKAWRPERAEQDLLRMNPGFRYLYYVGLGFWFGIRHGRHPRSLQKLASFIDPLYFPLCYDGFGFKLGFFDYPRDQAVVQRLESCPPEHRRFIHQGFGRSMFFVYMDDPDGFDELKTRMPREYRVDLEIGRSLACGFTGVDRPDELLRYIDSARDDEEVGARLTGVTWALTARRMNDPLYFAHCMEKADGAARPLLEPLPQACDDALEQAADYGDWQERTRDAVTKLRG